MLIAIMADTFDRVFENKQAAILKLKVETMSDFAFLMISEYQERFLFICTPKIKEVDEQQDWEGKLQAIKKIVTASSKEQKTILSDISDKQTKVEKNIDGPLRKVEELEEKITNMKNLNEIKFNELTRNDNKMDAKLDAILKLIQPPRGIVKSIE